MTDIAKRKNSTQSRHPLEVACRRVALVLVFPPAWLTCLLFGLWVSVWAGLRAFWDELRDELGPFFSRERMSGLFREAWGFYAAPTTQPLTRKD